MMIRDGKEYRNLEEQVLKNKEDIETLSEELGTQVIANPEGEASAELTKVQINEEIYSIPSGGSSDVAWGDITGSIADQTDLQTALTNKQNVLTAGSNITISENVISATDTTYSSLPAAEGGTDVSLVTTGEKYTWNDKQDKLTAGANITITNNVISATGSLSSVVWGQIGGSIADQTDLQTALSGKQESLVSGTNIKTINNQSILGSGNISIQGGGDVTDVQVNGTSVVNSSGVAGITISAAGISGSYNDLTDKPTIPVVNYPVTDVQANGTSVLDGTVAKVTVPTKVSDLNNDSGFITGISSGDVTSALGYTPVNPSSLATVATSGSYSDLSNKPTIPAAVSGTNDGTNWTSITIGQDTYAIPSGGGGGGGSYSAGDGISISSNVISMSYPMIIFLEEGD